MQKLKNLKPPNTPSFRTASSALLNAMRSFLMDGGLEVPQSPTYFPSRMTTFHRSRQNASVSAAGRAAIV